MYTHATWTSGWTSSSAVCYAFQNIVILLHKRCPIRLSQGGSYCALAAINLTWLSQYCACLHAYLIVCDHNLSQGYDSHTHIYTHILVYTYAPKCTHIHTQAPAGARGVAAQCGDACARDGRRCCYGAQTGSMLHRLTVELVQALYVMLFRAYSHTEQNMSDHTFTRGILLCSCSYQPYIAVSILCMSACGCCFCFRLRPVWITHAI